MVKHARRSSFQYLQGKYCSWLGVADPRMLAAITRFMETLTLPSIAEKTEHF
ncbi:MAG: hypothetical protein ACSHX9_01580 [Luteolibacter sp.]